MRYFVVFSLLTVLYAPITTAQSGSGSLREYPHGSIYHDERLFLITSNTNFNGLFDTEHQDESVLSGLYSLICNNPRTSDSEDSCSDIEGDLALYCGIDVGNGIFSDYDAPCLLDDEYCLTASLQFLAAGC